MSAKILKLYPDIEEPSGRCIVTVRAGMPNLNVLVEIDQALYYSLFTSEEDGTTRIRAIAAALLNAGANRTTPCTVEGLQANHSQMIKLQKELTAEHRAKKPTRPRTGPLGVCQQATGDTGPRGA
ncbi:MAG: hypothetical protein AB7T74_03085 [Clostridia bacterium]